MVEQSHLKLIKECNVEAWNEWRNENPEIRPDLSRADLREANLSLAILRRVNLSEANLSRAYLIGAKLYGANLSLAILTEANLSNANLSLAILSEANLSGANLSLAILSEANLSGANLKLAKLREANLIGAKLYGADLREANLRGADLSNADISGSDISGADITGANIHKWKIKGIKCTHAIWKEKRIDYNNPDDFEKSFAEIESVVEILVDMPFSDLSYYTGRIIEQAINRRYGEGSLIFKGQTATSDNTIRFEFLSDPQKFALIIKMLSELPNKLKPVIEEAASKNEPQSIIGPKSEIDIPFSGGTLVARPKEIERVLKERYTQMHPVLQKIFHTIQLHIR